MPNIRKYPIPSIGQMFGYWTVIDNTLVPSRLETETGKAITVQCKCGKIDKFVIAYLYKGKSTQCYKCRGKDTSKRKYTGYEQLSGTYFNQIENNARQRKLEFQLSKEYLWLLYTEQSGQCALSGLEISLSNSYIKDVRRGVYQTASVDRKDSIKGYVEGNVQWVHKDVNMMKRSLSNEEFINFCKQVVKWQKHL